MYILIIFKKHVASIIFCNVKWIFEKVTIKKFTIQAGSEV